MLYFIYERCLQTIFRGQYILTKIQFLLNGNMVCPIKLTFRYKISADGWFVVTSPDLPGLVTQARSQSELIEMVNDAVLTYFDVPKTKADIVYDQFNLGGELVQYQGQLQTKTI